MAFLFGNELRKTPLDLIPTNLKCLSVVFVNSIFAVVNFNFFLLTAPDRCYYLNQAYLSCVYSRSEKGEDQ